MTKYILANWKSHKTMLEAEAWLDAFLDSYRPDPDLKVIIAPPALYLIPLWEKLQEHKTDNLSLAIQDLSPFPLGAYTGSIAGEMVQEYAEYAILGHSERRRYFHETDQDVANKVSEARAANIKPIVCVDLPYARSQLSALFKEDLVDLIIGYGPVEAAGINISQPPEKAKEAIDDIGIMVPDKAILYGGSINKNNAGEYLNIPGVSGLMAGTAGLNPEEFALICEAASNL